MNWTTFLIRHFHIRILCMKFKLHQFLCVPRHKWDDKNNICFYDIWLLFVHFNISWATCWVASQRFHLRAIWTLSTLEVNPAYLVFITVQSAIKNLCDVFLVTTLFRNCSLHIWLNRDSLPCPSAQWLSSLNHICTYNAIKACNINPQPHWGQCMQHYIDWQYDILFNLLSVYKLVLTSLEDAHAACIFVIEIVIMTNSNAYLTHFFMSVMHYFRKGRPLKLTHQDALNTI